MVSNRRFAQINGNVTWLRLKLMDKVDFFFNSHETIPRDEIYSEIFSYSQLPLRVSIKFATNRTFPQRFQGDLARRA